MATAIIGIFAALLSGIIAYTATQKSNQFNQQQYEDWKAYNSPASQMERLSDAGLNKYLVSGVNNTLSQPFSVGANTGIAQGLSQMTNFAGNAGSLLETSRHNRAMEDLGEQRVENEKSRINLQKLGLDIRERMAKVAEKKGDAQAALLWSQGSIADLNKQFLKRTLPYRVGDEFYKYLLDQQMYTYNEQMFPLKLKYYVPYNQALINNLNTRSKSLNWQMDFNYNRWLLDNWHWNQEFGLKNQRFGLDSDVAYKRLGLSGRYFDLAQKKFWRDVIFDTWSHGLDTYKAVRGLPHITKKTQRTPGGYPTIFEYEYGF